MFDPIIVSVQAPAGTPLADTETIVKLAKTSVEKGANSLRIEGVENIRAVKKATGARIIGLIKVKYGDSEVIITPTLREVQALTETGCEAIAFDATMRERPEGTTVEAIFRRIREADRIAWADCDCLESAMVAKKFGACLVATTLAGYTDARPCNGHDPDIELIKELKTWNDDVIAEGRFTEPWQVQAALLAGAQSVVIGGAINDPLKQTARFLSVLPFHGVVGAFDIGGTWLRFARTESGVSFFDEDQIQTPRSARERLDWMRQKISERRVERVGISSGGTIDPHTGLIWESSELISGNAGTVYSKENLGVECVALNDGLATAWGAACLGPNAGLRIAALCLGTGVGFGLVDRGRILMGNRGEYFRINDLEFRGKTLEEAIGGRSLCENKSDPKDLEDTFAFAVKTVQSLYAPDKIVICGGVGLNSNILRRAVEKTQMKNVEYAVMKDNAGISGAAMLAMNPPQDLQHLVLPRKT